LELPDGWSERGCWKIALLPDGSVDEDKKKQFLATRQRHLHAEFGKGPDYRAQLLHFAKWAKEKGRGKGLVWEDTGSPKHIETGKCCLMS